VHWLADVQLAGFAPAFIRWRGSVTRANTKKREENFVFEN
jgi:hypothetical protein